MDGEKTKNIATMDAAELRQHINELKEKQLAELRALRALMRVREAEEETQDA